MQGTLANPPPLTVKKTFKLFTANFGLYISFENIFIDNVFFWNIHISKKVNQFGLHFSCGVSFNLNRSLEPPVPEIPLPPPPLHIPQPKYLPFLVLQNSKILYFTFAKS